MAALRTEAADKDLSDIAHQVGVESNRPSTAERILDELIDCCDQLASLSPQSQLGTAAPQLGAGVRLYSVKRWVVIFRYIDGGILVLRVADGSQDYLAWKL